MSEPIKGQAYEFFISLTDINDPQFFIVNPTIAAGDFKLSVDSGALGNLATLPVVAPAGSSSVKVNLSASEMAGDKIVVLGKDAVGEQWGDIAAFIDAPGGSSETVLDIIEGDHRESSVNLKIFKKGTSTIVLEKDITGSFLRSDITINTLEP